MKIGIVGVGAMGRGIAQIFAQCGHDVLMHDLSAQAIDSSLSSLGKTFAMLTERGKISSDDADSALAHLHAAPDLNALADADVVIEAIVEALGPKQGLFKQLEEIVGEQTILASNTSSLSVTEIASACKHPERVAGFHFFNPVPLMKIVEVIRGVRTNDQVIATLLELAKTTGHRAVTAIDSPGFIVNHAGRGYGTEALKILSEGVASFAQIDQILREQVNFNGRGFVLGPFELLDLTGLDVSQPVMCSIYDQFYAEPRFRPSNLAAQRYAAGLFGRKTNQGFFPYQNGRPIPADKPIGSNAGGELPTSVWIPECAAHAELASTVAELGAIVETGANPSASALILLAPLGLDATSASAGYDASRCIAIDTLFPYGFKAAKRRVLMSTPATDEHVCAQAKTLFGIDGAAVSLIQDSAGFVSQRVIAMIVAIACEIVQNQIASASDVDQAVKIGLGYPAGPISMGDSIGAATIAEILRNIHSVTADPRYRPSLWLQRRAQLKLPLLNEK